MPVPEGVSVVLIDGATIVLRGCWPEDAVLFSIVVSRAIKKNANRGCRHQSPHRYVRDAKVVLGWFIQGVI